MPPGPTMVRDPYFGAAERRQDRTEVMVTPDEGLVSGDGNPAILSFRVAQRGLPIRPPDRAVPRGLLERRAIGSFEVRMHPPGAWQSRGKRFSRRPRSMSLIVLALMAARSARSLLREPRLEAIPPQQVTERVAASVRHLDRHLLPNSVTNSVNPSWTVAMISVRLAVQAEVA